MQTCREWERILRKGNGHGHDRVHTNANNTVNMLDPIQKRFGYGRYTYSPCASNLDGLVRFGPNGSDAFSGCNVMWLSDALLGYSVYVAVYNTFAGF